MAHAEGSLLAKSVIGKCVDGLSLRDRIQLTGSWMAIELYSPARLPLRTIEALGGSVRECIVELQRRRLNPARYYFEALPAPYTDRR